MNPTTSPTTSQKLLPVMTLPGMRFKPCPTQTAPVPSAMTPRMIRTIRLVRLFIPPRYRRAYLSTGNDRWVTFFAAMTVVGSPSTVSTSSVGK